MGQKRFAFTAVVNILYRFKFFFNYFMKSGFGFQNPIRQGIGYDLPGRICHFHIEDDSSAAGVNYIYGKKAFLFAVRFSKIKFF